MIHHLCMNIEGAIANAKDLKGCIEVNGRTLETVKEVRDFLKGQLAKGRRVLPMCKCSNFDYRKGCLGHERAEAWLTLKRIGLNNPTEVEYKGKSLITVGLSIERLVDEWRRCFDLQDCDLYVETDSDTLTSTKRSVLYAKSVYELFAENNVFLREVQEDD